MVRDSGGAWHSLFTKRRGTSSKYVCFTFSCELGDSCVGIARREGIGDIRPVLERLAFRNKLSKIDIVLGYCSMDASRNKKFQLRLVSNCLRCISISTKLNPSLTRCPYGVKPHFWKHFCARLFESRVFK